MRWVTEGGQCGSHLFVRHYFMSARLDWDLRSLQAKLMVLGFLPAGAVHWQAVVHSVIWCLSVVTSIIYLCIYFLVLHWLCFSTGSDQTDINDSVISLLVWYRDDSSVLMC